MATDQIWSLPIDQIYNLPYTYAMDTRFELHNIQRTSLENFKTLDPQLRALKQKTFIHHHKSLNQLPQKTPGIYALTGGRQIGKSTMMKQWMLKLMTEGISPHAVYYLTGELIDDHHTLIKCLQSILNNMPPKQIHYLIIDEVTYIEHWDKGIKFLADAGLFEQTVLILTGSDTLMLETAIKRFPGRRGKASQVNFHIYPLSFRDVVELKNRVKLPILDIIHSKTFSDKEINLLYQEFNEYLIHGGFLTAINDYAANHAVLDATLQTYSEWIRGDLLRAGKQERYLREILGGIIKRYTSQITWHALAKDLSIDHHKTVSEYIELLSTMDAVYIVRALKEDTLSAAPKKARKVIFCDPFIYHAANAWCSNTTDEYHTQIIKTLSNTTTNAAIVEACVTTQIRCLYDTFYLKADGEVDIAYINENQFWPIEIKWTNQIHPKDIKQIKKYANGIIFTKTKQFSEFEGTKTIPLPIALLKYNY